jgi:hypothetical protein
VTLGSDIVAALPELRVEAESQMVTLGVVKRADGTSTEHPVTYEVTLNYVTIYTGKCKYKFPSTIPSVGSIPGAVVTDQRGELSFPVGTSGAIRTNDVWTCTANVLDPALVGVSVRIAGVHSQSLATARRFPVEEGS